MTLAPRHRRVAAWVALAAMLALALVPTVSRALAFAQGTSHWAAVCTPHGVKLLAADDQGVVPDAAGPLLEHCAFCALAFDGAAPLAATPASVPLLPLAAEVPAGLPQAAAALAWRTAQPRGPPNELA